ncbi:MAG: hypothetical protein EPN36_14600 [Rhodanobacteraceae bacterium]|nr:MAG: hypothetical protein EPN36_14600 [Rhodanobacteraceae bacterium]
MSGASFSGRWGRLARCAVALVGAVVLAGCATGYAYVQPNVAGSGGYYTSDNTYTGQGYYDWYGTGPYYPGTSGWGYYNGSSPYAGAFGWFDNDYDDFGFPFFFNLGISNVWGFPGYWGPWYSLNFPIWGCRDGCWRRHHRRGHWRHDGLHAHDPHDPHPAVIAHLSPPPGLKLERTAIAPHWRYYMVHPTPKSVEARPLDSARFAPRDFVRAPAQHRIVMPRFAPMPTSRPSFRAPSMAAAPRFAPQRNAAPAVMPRAFPAPQPVFTPAPTPAPAPRAARKPGIEIR